MEMPFLNVSLNSIKFPSKFNADFIILNNLSYFCNSLNSIYNSENLDNYLSLGDCFVKPYYIFTRSLCFSPRSFPFKKRLGIIK